MKLSYEDVKGVSSETFNSRAIKLTSKHRKTTPEELRQVEALLEVQLGTLENLNFYMEQLTCESCNKEFGLYEFVRSAIRDAGHSTSLILHTFVGTKYILNEARFLRCSGCNNISRTAVTYTCQNQYSCGPSVL